MDTVDLILSSLYIHNDHCFCPHTDDCRESCEKSSAPHDRVAIKTTFSSKILEESVVTVFLPYCRGILACSFSCFRSLRFTGIHYAYKIVHMQISTALLRYHHSISVGLRCGLRLSHYNTLILFFFSKSAVDLMLC